MNENRRVLIVDDDSDFAESLLDILEPEHYRIETVNSANGALSVAKTFAPHVALLDLRLGQTNGLDLLKILSQHYPGLLCIIMTAYADVETAIKALQRDAYGYLRKPLYPEELFATLKRCFDKIDLEQKHQQATIALRTSEERYRSIFENAVEGVFRCASGEGFTDVNPALVQMLGYNSKEEVLALDIEKELYVHSDELHDVRDRLQANKIIKNIEVSWKKHNSDHIIVSLNAQLVRDAQGQILLYEGMVQDISERKRAEVEVHSLNTELEARVKTRTAELEYANRQLKDFAYVVSHDLKAPLRNVSQLASWLRDDYASVFDDNGREMTDLLIGRVKRMDSLIDGILKYTRVERIRGVGAPIDLNQIVADVLDSLAPPEHIHITLTHELPTLIVERTQIFQVFQNLIENAIKFMDKPRGEIMILCVEDEEYWRFSVADNGPGIETEYYERIFQIFQTVSPRHESESAGVGLAIVKKIVELQGGKIWVESQAGQKTTFSFTVPKS